MRKYAVEIKVAQGVVPGVYLVCLPDGLPPQSTVTVEMYDAEVVLKKAEGTDGGAGINFAGLSEKVAPAIASLAMRFF